MGIILVRWDRRPAAVSVIEVWLLRFACVFSHAQVVFESDTPLSWSPTDSARFFDRYALVAANRSCVLFGDGIERW